jgi:hypothetical protein
VYENLKLLDRPARFRPAAILPDDGMTFTKLPALTLVLVPGSLCNADHGTISLSRNGVTVHRGNPAGFPENTLPALVLHHSGVTTGKVRKIRAAGMEAGAGTVNDRALMETLLAMGVQRIYTDDPRLLLEVRAGSEP